MFLEFCEISKNNFFHKTPLVAASKNLLNMHAWIGYFYLKIHLIMKCLHKQYQYFINLTLNVAIYSDLLEIGCFTSVRNLGNFVNNNPK